MSNADKIVWGPSSINELKRALGLDGSVEDSNEDEDYISLQPPWPIVVSSQSSIVGTDGSIETTAVLTFDEVLGASGYQVRISPAEDYDVVEGPEIFTANSNETDNWSADGTNFFEHTVIPPQTIQAGDIGLIIGPGHNTNYTGGFSTWTTIYDGGDANNLGIWKGTGVGAGNIVATPGGGTLVDNSFFIFLHLRGLSSLTLSTSSKTTPTLTEPQTTVTTPAVAGPNGKLVLTALRTGSGGLSNRAAPNGYWLDSGFYGKFYRHQENSTSNAFYNNGVACSIGISLGNTVSTQFGVWVDGTKVSEVGTFIFNIT